MPLTLEITAPDGAKRVETLEQPVVKVGRDARSHVCLDAPEVSRMHAVIEQQGPDTPVVVDLGSDLGTQVNGERVNKRRLRAGDVLAIGGFTLRVLATDADAPVASGGGAEAHAGSAAGPARGDPLLRADSGPASPAVRKRVREYAARLKLPTHLLDALADGPATAIATSFWQVEADVWWERRFFRYKGARETAADANRVHFGSLTLPAWALPDRWSLTCDRPEEFHSFARRTPIEALPVGDVEIEELELEVLFGVQTHVASLGDAGFPAAFLDALPVNARFQGVDSVPVVTARGATPYREASVPADRPDIPSAVMQVIRDFVRHIDLPGYADRIHGWRTTVRGGPFVRARFALGERHAPLSASVVDAVVVESAGLVYAPDLSDA